MRYRRQTEDNPGKNRLVLWRPSAEWKKNSNMSAYMRWLEDEKKLFFRALQKHIC